MTLVSVGGVAVEHGRTVILEDVSLVVARGERWGVIGRNGAGKTTLFDVITGEREPTRGSVARLGGVRIAKLDQHRGLGEAATVWDAAAGAFAELVALEHALAEQAERIGALGDGCPPEVLTKYGHDLERFAHEGGYEMDARVDAILDGLGFDHEDARTRPVAGLSGGERGRLALARQLAEPADLLLLDEPTNHLDLATTRWLEDHLKSLDAAVMVVSHDRAFLEAIADHVLHVADRTATAYRGNYSSFVRQHAERQLSAARAFDKQSKSIAAEEDYIRRNIAGGNSAQAKGRRRRLTRLPRLSPPPTDEATMALRLTSGSRGGDQVVVADKLRVAIGERELLVGASVTLRRGEVVGFVGSNGAGKSTLLSVLTGGRAADGGGIRLGDSVVPGFYRQDLSQVPLDKTIYDVIHDLRPGWSRGLVQGHLGRFGFSGEEVFRRTDTLSGGERARVALAMLMLSEANFLILDEPTNHLDVESIEALEDAIEAFEGTVLLVSHDRAFLRALTDRTWVLEDGRLTDYPGGFAEWEETEAERKAVARREQDAEGAARRDRERSVARKKDTGSRDDRSRQADRRKQLEAAEATVLESEAALEALEAELADPDLYQRPGGTERAAELAQALDPARRARDAAYELWARLSESAE